MPRKNVSCSVLLTLMSWASLAISASAQHFQQVTGTLVSVAAGRNEVFGIDAHGLPWRYNATKQSFAKVSGAKSLVQIAVGGGTLSQLDEVWAVGASGDVYRFDFGTKTFDEIPYQSLSQITVGEGVEDDCHPYEVWGLAPDSPAYFSRYDYCNNTFSLLAQASWTQAATGGGDVWGIYKEPGATDGTPYHLFEGELFPVEGLLLQIAVGLENVWGIDSSSNIWRYDFNTNQFVQVGGALTQIAAGGDGVWGINQYNDIYRFDPGTASWVEVPGVLKEIAVGSGAGVWGVNSSNQVFTFVRP